MADHRKAPWPEHYDNTRPWGCCVWCGKDIKREDGSINKRRRWHPECQGEMAVTKYPDAMRRAVYDRDKGICSNCGSDTHQWMPDDGFCKGGEQAKYRLCRTTERDVRRSTPRGFPAIFSSQVVHDPSDKPLLFFLNTTEHGFAFTAIEWRANFHADHKVPLWKVAHLPDAERFQYFTLQNNQTLCVECHTHKSRREAAERAMLRRKSKREEENDHKRLKVAAKKNLTSKRKIPSKPLGRKKLEAFMKGKKR